MKVNFNMFMSKQTPDKRITWGLGITSALVLIIWLSQGPSVEVEKRVPNMDITEATPTQPDTPQVWDGALSTLEGTPSDITGAWPCFRGTNHDAISLDPTPLSNTWPEGGPPVVWKMQVGEGFAAPVIWEGRVYMIDYDTTNEADVLRCMSLDNGADIWRYSYSEKVKRNHGMSRTIPTVSSNCVVSIGPKCQVIAADPVTGKLLWRYDLVDEFDTEVPPWYAGQNPLIDDGKVIIAPGGTSLIIAVEPTTGEILWKTPNPKLWKMTHSSVIPMELNGTKTYVYCAGGGVVGVAADDGRILWQTPDWQIKIANIPSPLPLPGNRVFLSGGYGEGSMMIRINENNGEYAVETLFKLSPKEFGSVQQTPIFYNDHIFGVRPDGRLVCLNLDGKVVWTSGTANEFGSGSYMLIQDMIYLMSDEGVLTLAEASTKSYNQLAQAKVLEGPEAWGPMATAGGYLIVRDLYYMACLDISAPE